ncbi:glycoside hydrolase family 18 protein [Flavimarina sp. Hel_I_48]|uniref:glycoside hydrolase family 18 protein n=1 Tax=Flavimarina sp. Hel_I_48 TaxID=1392488 RepID=UPI00068DD31D|nr:glycoside hydrolase family 18 protein [Flavimarina sp. Hel_I_48]
MNSQKSLISFLFSLWFFTICWAQTELQSDKNHSKRIIAYVYGWQDNWGPNFEKAKMITHINFAFANIKDGKVVEGNKNDGEVLKKLNKLKKVNPELKILISVGGWGWSGNFSDVVLTEKSRQLFANSAIAFIQKHHLDGVDLDWEYPGQVGAGNTFRPEDKGNFTQILKLLRKKLDSAATPKKEYLLTIATGANQKYLDHTNLGEAQKYLDFLNIMTYDFYTGGSTQTGHHANLFKSDQETAVNHRSVNIAVQQHLKAGVPAEKIVMGVPFYGRWWKGAKPKNNGLYQQASGETGGYDYKIIADSLKTGQWAARWDNTAQAPYFWREQDSLFMTYENPKSLKLKVDYVNKNDLGGVMFWEFNGDNGELLKTIYSGFSAKN